MVWKWTFDNLKESFFKKRNIQIFTVRENEWKKDRHDIINKVEQFLG